MDGSATVAGAGAGGVAVTLGAADVGAVATVWAGGTAADFGCVAVVEGKVTIAAGAGVASTGAAVGAGNVIGCTDSVGAGSETSACGGRLGAGASSGTAGLCLATAIGLPDDFVSESVMPTETSTMAMAPRHSQRVLVETGSLGVVAWYRNDGAETGRATGVGCA